MKPAAMFSVIAAGFLLALAQTLATIAGLLPSLLVGVADGFLVFPLFRMFGAEWGLWWVPLAASVAASCVGVFTGSLGAVDPEPSQWLSPVFAAAACLAATFIGRSRSQVCQLCRQRTGGALAFECPRCGLLVCEQRCWRFDSCRCRLCADQAVPVFAAEPRWWDEHFGARAPSGKCLLCLSDGSAVDLRACPNCGRLHCRECWDYANGQCSQCGWILPDLPPALKRYMFTEGRSAATGGAARPSRRGGPN